MKDLITALRAWAQEDNGRTRMELGTRVLCERTKGVYLSDAVRGLVDEVMHVKQRAARVPHLQKLAVAVADALESDPGELVFPSGEQLPERRDVHG